MKYYSETDVKELIDYAIAYGTDITNYCPSLEDYPSIELGWHTGTPTDEGWYLVAYKKRDCDGSFYWEYGARLWIEIMEGEGDWNVCEEKHPVVAWQKIEPYREASE